MLRVVDDKATTTDDDNDDDVVLDSSRMLQPQQKRRKNKQEEEESYTSLLMSNRPLRLFFASYAITQVGNWFTYVASLVALQQILQNQQNQQNQNQQVWISVLVVLRLIPNSVFFAPAGSGLADAMDRRWAMFWLNVGGACVGLWLVLAYRSLQSAVLLILLNFVQQSLAALYEPCRAAIFPMTLDNDDDDHATTMSFLSSLQQQRQQQRRTNALTKIATLEGITWSLMNAIGSSLGGFTVHLFEITTNFCEF